MPLSNYFKLMRAGGVILGALNDYKARITASYDSCFVCIGRAWPVVITLVTCLVSHPAHAREWYIKPGANLRLEFDDNILLRQENIGDVYGFRASFFADSGTRTETSDVGLTAKVNAYQYWGAESNALNRVDAFVYGHSSFQMTERSSIGLDASYVHDNSVTSELDTTGLTQNPVPREMYDVSPHFSYTLSELQSVRVGYTHQVVDYDNTTNTRFTSYITDSLNLSFQHQWREDLLYYLSFSSLWYQLTDFDSQTSNYNLSAGLDYSFSETLKFNFMLGLRFTDSTSSFESFSFEEGFIVRDTVTTTSENSSIGPLFGFGLHKQFEFGYFDFDYNRIITPSSVGELLQVDRINIKSLYNVTEHLGLMLLVSINKTDQGNDSFGNNSRIYYSVQPKLIWNFSRQMSVSVSYRFRMNKYDNRDGSAVSNGVYMTINYQWDKLSTNEF